MGVGSCRITAGQSRPDARATTSGMTSPPRMFGVMSSPMSRRLRLTMGAGVGMMLHNCRSELQRPMLGPLAGATSAMAAIRLREGAS